jgi:hypothetical protein
VPVGVLCVLALVGFLFYRRRKSGRQEINAVHTSELPAENAVVEMSAAPTPKESGRNLVAELEAREQYR